jgi:RNA polymerase sigma-70 factor (ECF subfamily)
MQPDQNSFLEGEALSLAQQGNAAAFEFLYRLHHDRVYALCLRMVKNPVQAEDLTQETFLAVLRGIREFRGQSAFTTWLH